MGAHARPPRAAASRPDGQHFLRSRSIATEIVRDAGVRAEDHVVEIGAGTGRLTEPLAERARRVTAIELDPRLVRRLSRTFDGRDEVRIVQGDVLRIEPPTGRWRAFGNIPFGLTTAILRRLLDDPETGLDRADLILQFEAARKRAAIHPGTLRSMAWLPWWEFAIVRRIPRSGFDPAPSVDAALLRVTRREEALLPAHDRHELVGMLTRAFAHGSTPVRRSLRDAMPSMAWKRLARERGFPVDARPPDLDVWDWVAVVRAVTASRPRRS